MTTTTPSPDEMTRSGAGIGCILCRCPHLKINDEDKDKTEEVKVNNHDQEISGLTSEKPPPDSKEIPTETTPEKEVKVIVDDVDDNCHADEPKMDQNGNYHKTGLAQENKEEEDSSQEESKDEVQDNHQHDLQDKSMEKVQDALEHNLQDVVPEKVQDDLQHDLQNKVQDDAQHDLQDNVQDGPEHNLQDKGQDGLDDLQDEGQGVATEESSNALKRVRQEEESGEVEPKGKKIKKQRTSRATKSLPVGADDKDKVFAPLPESPPCLNPPDSFFAQVHSGARRLTRWKRSITGVSLHNPFVYDDCLLCTRGFYREVQLREHYAKVHELDFGTAPLPRNLLALESFEKQKPCTGPLSNKCSICNMVCEGGLRELLRHKMTAHVNPKFMRYSCDECGGRFVLASLLKEHECQKQEQAAGDEPGVQACHRGQG